jgi:hypothetical protein
MLLPALHDRLVLQQNQTSILFFASNHNIFASIIKASKHQLLCIIFTYHYRQQQTYILSEASRTTKILIVAHIFHQYNQLESIMHFFTAIFSLFAATATAFPTKPGYLTQPVARDAGDVSLIFLSMHHHHHHSYSNSIVCFSVSIGCRLAQ